jgi:glycolate oxidase FAD binding subunit
MAEIYSPSSENEVVDFIKDSYSLQTPIEISGNNSKPIGRLIQCSKSLQFKNFNGIVEYLPEELYIKVKSGTSLALIEAELDKKNQELAFEPSDMGFLYSGKSNKGSVGGAVACNLSGSRRFRAGALRDHILGFCGVNGKGEIIKSGGTVVKNVTGYDVSKLITGSYGTLVALTEIVLKVQPKNEESQTLLINNINLKMALNVFSKAMHTSVEISGACFYPAKISKFFKLNDLDTNTSITAIRLEGPKISVTERVNTLKKLFSDYKTTISVLENYQSRIFWQNTTDLQFFNNSKNVVAKIVLPPLNADQLMNKFENEELKYVVDWAGNLIWVELPENDSVLLKHLKTEILKLSGHMTIIKAPNHVRIREDFLTTVDENIKVLSLKIKESFDPKKILNPGKMYSGI